jgi:hypothetical protein
MVCFVFETVIMVWYVLFLEVFSWYGMFCYWSCSLQNQNIPYHENSSKNKTYHTMRTAPKTKNILNHENTSKNKTYHTMKTVPKTKHTIP